MQIILIPIIIFLVVRLTNPVINMQVLFWIAITGIFMGIFTASEEILSERHIYRREHNFNVRLRTYLASKITVFSLFALTQSLIITLLLLVLYNWIAPDQGGVKFVNIPGYFLFFAFLTTSSSLLGLLISSIFSTIKQVMYAILAILLLQIIFSGVIAPIKSKWTELPSYFFLGRWGTEGFARIQGNHEGFKTKDTLCYDVNSSNKKQGRTSIVKLKIVDASKSVYSTVPVPVEDTFRFMSDTGKANKTLFGTISEERSDTEFLKGHFKMEPYFSDSTDREKIDPLSRFNYSGRPFNSLPPNLLAIVILDFLVLIVLTFQMKRKDPIKT